MSVKSVSSSVRSTRSFTSMTSSSPGSTPVDNPADAQSSSKNLRSPLSPGQRDCHSASLFSTCSTRWCSPFLLNLITAASSCGYFEMRGGRSRRRNTVPSGRVVSAASYLQHQVSCNFLYSSSSKLGVFASSSSSSRDSALIVVVPSGASLYAAVTGAASEATFRLTWRTCASASPGRRGEPKVKS